MNLEESIRKIVVEEIDKRQQKDEYVPIAEFLQSKKLSRLTIRRQELEGKVKLIRIGKRVFINPSQFHGA